MKKRVFLFICLLMLVVVSPMSIYAGAYHDTENGVYITASYSVEQLSSGKYFYGIVLELRSDAPNERGCSLLDSVLWYGYAGDDDFSDDLKVCDLRYGSFQHEHNDIDGKDTIVATKVTMSYTSNQLLYDATGHNQFCMYVKYQSNGADVHTKFVNFELKGNVPDVVEPTATPKPTSTPKPTATPKPDPTATPKPTSTPTPKPTATPKPTPTNTPTPTPSPTPAPILRLDAAANNNTAEADYYTGGCTPVKSTIEFYEIDMLTGDPMKIDGESFISGSGSRSDLMEPGKLYRYKLTYVYERSGVQFTEVLWSIDLRCVDQELEDYRERGQVNNFRTLILCIWEEFMEIGIPIDGFNLKFRSLYIWIMIAGLAVFFFKKWNG